MTNSQRVSQVLARLDRVNDPELDESVTSLGFVSAVDVTEDGTVEVGFRLPTYWCAANFAFLMADDMRTEIGHLPWVRQIRVKLGEHMYADTINTAMESGQSFQEAFAAEADGNLDEVRRIFEVKAFQRRQMMLLDELMSAGHEAENLVRLTVDELPPSPLAHRYLERRGVVGLAGPGALAFVDETGAPITDFAAHRRTLRRVAVNVEFNGALCRGLLAARFDEPGTEPTLLDFVHGRVPEQPRAQT